MRVGFVSWPDGLQPGNVDWNTIASSIDQAGLDLLVTNELPFGPWIAAHPVFDRELAQHSIGLHEEGLAALADLSVRSVITSRPVWSGNRLVNEAVVLADGAVRPWRRKRYFPAESGWHETEWYIPGGDDFPAIEIEGVRIGVLLCTEAMFNERARNYGRDAVDLIVIPRATRASPMWRVAGQMAAIVSGSYVVSSNRHSGAHGAIFGGGAFAFAPDGAALSASEHGQTLAIVELDRQASIRQKHAYPCYVASQVSP